MKFKIDKFDYFGNGIIKREDKVIFVKKALPGEIVNINIIDDKKKFQIGEVQKILVKSDKRVSPVCPYYNICGGCNFLHCTKEEENNFKINKTYEMFGIKPKIYLTNEYNYRNKVTLHVEGDRIGFYKEKTHNIIDIEYCYLLNNNINNILKRLNSYVKNYSVFLSEIILKSVNNKMLMAIKGTINKHFLDTFKDVDEIIVNDKIVKGKGYLINSIKEFKFKVTPDAFFQVNNRGLEKIFEILSKSIYGNYPLALDLYGGSGVMGILLTKLSDKVVSIDSNYESYLNGLFNKKINKLSNIEFINAKVEEYVDKLDKCNLIVVDPPRSGLKNNAIKYLCKAKATTLIYISCNMATLKRDIDALNNTYKINDLYLVDMFPKTMHVECVSVLHRKTFEK